MKKYMMIVMVLAVLSIMANRASAGAFYGSAGFMYSLEQFDGAGVDADDSIGFTFRAGTTILPLLAAEVAFDYNNEFDLGGGFSADSWRVMAHGKYYPLPGPLKPYALVGVGFETVGVDVTGVDDESGLVWRFGAGADFTVTPNIDVFGEVSYIISDLDLGGNVSTDTIPLVVGLKYNFL